MSTVKLTPQLLERAAGRIAERYPNAVLVKVATTGNLAIVDRPGAVVGHLDLRDGSVHLYEDR